jgi:ABC-type transport system involved in multi-copper enzyme maturation permease subunit
MTASNISSPIRAVATTGGADRFAGFRPLYRKDLAEWRHGRRAWVILIVTSLLLALTAANSWIIMQVVAATGAPAPEMPLSVDGMENLLSAVGSQMFIIAAIFASMSLIVAEREQGTMPWVASKPVGRGGIVLAKMASATTIVSAVTALVPVALTAALVAVLYGVPAIGPVAIVIGGAVATVAFIVAVSVAASTLVSNQAAVAGIGFGVVFLVPLLAGLVPLPIAPFLPTSILDWSIGLAMGAPVGFATPLVWAASIVALGAIAVARLERQEL